ncbi:AMP-dependent synthetase and ligase [Gloeothece citriformis PCC 7424]|uniref:AMP-dependent synthetase and ligase n=1 Tax=Gloeothece citriformis (strain PCC 7424) TaxID=65393 RepID=B7KD85_GLOC7|nr:AMP-binding protein [Gloeothece citriformis]ACK68905.1 AMP-dependent synthetase and ligase [Gloeothece citriformis PCC 7424]
MSKLVDYSKINSLSEIWPIAKERFKDIVALHDPHSKPEVIITYTELCEQIEQFARGLQALGVESGAKIALFADNCPRWFIADQGIIMAGAVNAVRSSQAERQELLYIYTDSDSIALVVEDLKTLQKLRPELDQLNTQFVILLSDEYSPTDDPLKILNFKQLLDLGSNHPFNPVSRTKEDLATLLYTSGTTGKPKGVMLTHGNFLYEINSFGVAFQPDPGDRVLSILPSWHAYERTVEYYVLSQGSTQIYTNLRNFKNDLKQFKPHLMVGVPRLWESIYESIQKQFREQPAKKRKIVNFFLNLSENYVIAKRIANNFSLDHLDVSASERLMARVKATVLAPLHRVGDRLVYQKIREGVGGKVKAWISGGGSLARHIDTFYEIVNIPVLVGYGLTETSPVTNVRTLDHNVRGSSGPPLPRTEIRIVDPETRQDLPPKEKGLVLIRGPQVMQGYYKKPEATAKAIDPQGWFDSGDLGCVTPINDLVLTGRAKDTIVLSNGENIEPQPIEDACVRSPYIDQIMLVGQDQKALGALIVPNLDALSAWGKEQQLDLDIPDIHASRDRIKHSSLYDKPVQTLLRQELNQRVKDRPGYRIDDQIKVFELILEPFSIDNGMMTQTLKIKRPVVTERYRAIIDGMYSQ